MYIMKCIFSSSCSCNLGIAAILLRLQYTYTHQMCSVWWKTFSGYLANGCLSAWFYSNINGGDAITCLEHVLYIMMLTATRS